TIDAKRPESGDFEADFLTSSKGAEFLLAGPSVFFLYIDLLEYISGLLDFRTIAKLGRPMPSSAFCAAIAATRDTHPSAEVRSGSIAAFNKRFSNWRSRQTWRAIESLLVDEVRPRI